MKFFKGMPTIIVFLLVLGWLLIFAAMVVDFGSKGGLW
jgi:hypothetical protein